MDRTPWQYSREQTRKMVLNYVSVKKDNPIVEAIVNHCMAFGEGIWHSTAAVAGRACWCAECQPEVLVRS